MRVYSVIFDQVSCSAAQDVFSIKASATVGCKLLAVYLAQSTKATDANNAQQRWKIRRGQTTQGSGGTTPTAQPVEPGDAAAGGTVHVNDTTQASAGTIVTLHDDVFNIEAGLIWIATPEQQFRWAAATCLTVEFPAMAVTATFNGTLYYAETA
jgi:hypothetical protein